jgi:ketosteroid isomerase-like protein
MKREVLMKRVLLAATAVLLAGPGPSSAQMSKAAAARAALLQTDVEWAASAAGTDVERIVSYWTDDAVIYAPREAPVAGKAAIRKYVGDSLKIPGFSVSWKPAAAVVSASGDLGYTTGTNTFTFPDAQGRPTMSNGRYVTVWRREADRRWRCVVDFWNEAPPGPR